MEAKIDAGGNLAPEANPNEILATLALPGHVSKTILVCSQDDFRRGHRFLDDFGCFQEDLACFQDHVGPLFCKKKTSGAQAKLLHR